MIYHKHVSDRQRNILTPPVERNNFSNSEGRISPVNVGPIWQPHNTDSFNPIDLKKTQRASYVSQLSAEKTVLNFLKR